MSSKRKDNKGRVLHSGEYQQSNGRYRYKYYDGTGKARYLYSWRLDKNDRMPDGKRQGKSLREQEQELQATQFGHIALDGGNLTVLELVRRYTATKIGVRESTKAGYQTTINFLEKDPFGQRRIDTIKISDAKLWLITLQQRQGKGYSTIHTTRGILGLAFRLAYDDDLIRRNSFDFELATVIVNDSVTREAITRDQERKYLEFVKQDKHFSRYYEGVFILFNTGLRISEFVGLTTKNIDFKHHKIIVDHQLIRSSKMQYMIEEPKTESGVREIPMSEEVEAAFRAIIAKRVKPKVEPMIDGYSGFLYLDKNNMPMVALHWEKYFQHILQKYNSIYKVQMPKVTLPCMQTYLLLQNGKEWHESQEPAVYHRTLGYQRYTEHIHSCKIRGCRGGDEEGCSNLNGLNTTKSTGVRLGVCTLICTPVVPLFPQKYRIL